MIYAIGICLAPILDVFFLCITMVTNYMQKDHLKNVELAPGVEDELHRKTPDNDMEVTITSNTTEQIVLAGRYIALE